MTPPQHVVDALDRLNNSPEFRVVLDWLEDRVATEVERAIKTADGADVLRGRAQFGVDLLETIRKNPDTAKRMGLRRR